MHIINQLLYVYCANVGSASITRSMSLIVSVRYTFRYLASKYSLKAYFIFGLIFKNTSTVHIVGSLQNQCDGM